jgi:hypothetical protein
LNLIFSFCAVALAVAQIAVPRRLAFLPLLIAAYHFPNMSILGMGAFHFSITRLLIVVGLIRAVFSGNLVWSRRNPLDLIVAVWAGIAIISSLAHESEELNPWVFRMGLVFNVAGTYLCARAYIRDLEAFATFAKCLMPVLVLLAFFMMLEKATGRNPYALLGASEIATVRDGHVRAGGPFGHPILAGTAGASSLAIVLSLWRRKRPWAVAGAVACGLITFSSASSGPVMTLAFTLVALGFWRWRTKMRQIRWAVLILLICLHMVMKVPVWYLLGRIDITGSSTGFHRAELINSAIVHLNEWWFLGTDHTRHWMATGVSWSQNHTDITNHYLQMGVLGGLPLMFSFIAILVKAFQLLGRRMAELRRAHNTAEFVIWCVGATLFAHSMTFLSVAYFDQNTVLFCLAVGVVPALCIRNSANRHLENVSCSLVEPVREFLTQPPHGLSEKAHGYN